MVRAEELMRYERELMAEGCRLICGVDEVGRGPLAGPVTCAAVIMPLDSLIEGVNDSKKVAKKKRERLAEEIKSRAIAWSVVSYDNGKIDEMNILNATRACMAEAVNSLSVTPDVVIVEGDEHAVLCEAHVRLHGIAAPGGGFKGGEAVFGMRAVVQSAVRDRKRSQKCPFHEDSILHFANDCNSGCKITKNSL